MSLWQRFKSLFKPRERPPDRATRLELKVAELQTAVNKLCTETASLVKDLAGRPLDIHIDRVLIDKVNLEQLVFNIDDIGVKDLSGSLSIGVNYGGRVMRVTAATPQKGEDTKKPRFTEPRPLTDEQTRVQINFRD